MASTMASTFALSRPSEKLGTHSTNVFDTRKRINQQGSRRFRILSPAQGLDGTSKPEPDSLNNDVSHERRHVGACRPATPRTNARRMAVINPRHIVCDEDCRKLSQYPSVLASPAGSTTSTMQIMYRICAATHPASELPRAPGRKDSPASRSWTADRNSSSRASAIDAPSARCS